MSVVSLLGAKLVNNPAPFLAPYQFEITFECLEQLQKGESCAWSSLEIELWLHLLMSNVLRSGMETHLRRFRNFVSQVLWYHGTNCVGILLTFLGLNMTKNWILCSSDPSLWAWTSSSSRPTPRISNGYPILIFLVSPSSFSPAATMVENSFVWDTMWTMNTTTKRCGRNPLRSQLSSESTGTSLLRSLEWPDSPSNGMSLFCFFPTSLPFF